jgi:hypothetical protein
MLLAPRCVEAFSSSVRCPSGIPGSARVSRAGDGVLAIANFRIDNSFSLGRLSVKWERSSDVDIASSGSSEIAVRGMCMFTMQRNDFSGGSISSECAESKAGCKKLIKVIEELKREGRL